MINGFAAAQRVINRLFWLPSGSQQWDVPNEMSHLNLACWCPSQGGRLAHLQGRVWQRWAGFKGWKHTSVKGKCDNWVFRGKMLIGILIRYFMTSQLGTGVSNKQQKFFTWICMWSVSHQGHSMVTTTPVAAAEGLIVLGAWPMSSGWWKGSINYFKSLMSGHSVLNHSTPLSWNAHTHINTHTQKMSPV